MDSMYYTDHLFALGYVSTIEQITQDGGVLHQDP